MLQAEAAMSSPRKMQASLAASMVQYYDRLSYVGVSKTVTYLPDRISQLHEVFDRALVAKTDLDGLPLFATVSVSLAMPEVLNRKGDRMGSTIDVYDTTTIVRPTERRTGNNVVVDRLTKTVHGAFTRVAGEPTLLTVYITSFSTVFNQQT